MSRKIFLCFLISLGVLWNTTLQAGILKPKTYTLSNLEWAARHVQSLKCSYLAYAVQNYRISKLKKYPFKEILEGLAKLIDRCSETESSLGPNADQIGTIEMAISVLSSIATINELHFLESLMNHVQENLADTAPTYAKELERFWKDAKIDIKKRRGPLHSIEENKIRLLTNQPLLPLPVSLEKGSQNSRWQAEMNAEAQNESQAPQVPVDTEAYLQHVRNFMEARVIEQPEGIDAFLRLEKRKLFYKASDSSSNIITLMGLPGVGKDTLAENYVDAIYGFENAYKKHLFRVPVLNNSHDAWSLLGSATGYLGSHNLSPLIVWLVNHSGGRYRIGHSGFGSNSTEHVEENPNWVPGTVLESFYSPQKAVLFVNEFHDWAKTAKNIVLKEAFEKNIFKINNPGKGLKEIEVPITIVIASNYGINLLAARELNGARYGEPLPYSKLLERWRIVAPDKKQLKDAILEGNGRANQFSNSESAKGTSEEILNRLSEAGLLLLRPISPQGLQKIAAIKINKIKKQIVEGGSEFSNLDFSVAPGLISFLQNYHYIAEENARPVQDRVDSLFEATILDAVYGKKIEPSLNKITYQLDVESKPDGTAQMIFSKLNEKGEEVSRFAQPISQTEQDRKRGPMPSEKIKSLLDLDKRMANHVMADPDLLKHLSRSILVAEESGWAKDDPVNPSQKAKTFMFLGLSSTGKTQTGKALARELTGNEDALKIIDFSQVTSIQDMKNKILGTRDFSGDFIPSDFMKHYDRLGGKCIFVFDEISNASKEALRALYDILREPVVTTFADNKPRSMGGITIIITGNAGEEWYKDIPHDIPALERQYAMESVYQEALASPGYRRKFLEQFFTEAFINRIGMRNIFFFGPLSFKSVRQLSQMKLMLALQKLRPKDDRYGWEVSFANRKDFLKLLEDVETHGYDLDEQGASIDRFVNEEFYEKLYALLLEKQIPIGSRVNLVPKGLVEIKDAKKHRRVLQYEVLCEKVPHPFILEMTAKDKEHLPNVRPEDRVLTAIHEAGHELVRKILFKEKYKSKKISIIPGVANIANHWVRYLGIAKSEKIQDFSYTRNAVLNEIAVFFAGEVAQTLVTKGGIHDFGKANDMERATQLATVAILKGGLSEAWGRETMPPDMKQQEYLATLSEQRRNLLNSEIAKMMNEARLLALSVLLKNRGNALIPLGLHLAEKGDMDEDDLDNFYGKTSLYFQISSEALESAKNYQPEAADNPFQIEAELVKDVPVPANMANIYELANQHRKRELEAVPVPDTLSYFEIPRISVDSSKAMTGCEGALRL